jgi:PAS domain S-box-containing protein
LAETSTRSAVATAGSVITDELLRLLVLTVKDYAIFLLDPDGFVASWNEGAQRIKGYTEPEIVGKHFSVFYRPETVASGWPAHELKRAAEDGRFEDEGWRIRKDGTEFWADVVITALRDQTGVLRGFAKVTRDLTERKRAEETLRTSEERYRLLVDGVRDYAIFMLDPEGRVMTWNYGAERLKGYKADEIIGQHFSRFYPPDAASSDWPQRELAIARQEGRFEDEGWRVRKDGTQFWANVVLTALYSDRGELRGFSKVTRDITERKKYEERVNHLNAELTARVEELAETNRELTVKGQDNEMFVYSVSHDVRGPLVNLQGFSQELERACEELRGLIDTGAVAGEGAASARRIVTEDMPESLGFMQKAVAHLSAIVDSLLRLSRLGRVVYQPQAIDVGAIVQRTVGALQKTIGDQHAEIVVKDMPPVTADAAAVEQVFTNLIGNALRYHDPQRRLRIEIGGYTTSNGKRNVYYVKDNGLGIPQSAVPKLFMAFRRFHPESGPGEGMGLATVRRIAERLQGSIRVESESGAGSTFYLDLPAGDRHETT